MAAKWEAWGLDHLERRLLSIEPRRRARPSSAARSGREPGSRCRTRFATPHWRPVGCSWRRPSSSHRSWTTCPGSGRCSRSVAGLEDLEWFGSGPHETYPDRKRGGLIGRWRSTVADQYVPYIRPQENGGHADVRWLRLSDDDGRGLRIAPGRPSQVSATHFRASDLAAATHDVELQPAAGDGRPPGRGPPRTRDRELRPGHAARTTSSAPGRIAGPGASAIEEPLSDVDRLGSVRPPVPPPATGWSAWSSGCSRTGRWASSTWGRRCRPGARTGTWVRIRSRASRTGSARRSRWPTRRAAPATSGCRPWWSAQPTAPARWRSTTATIGSRPESRRSTGSHRPTSRTRPRPTPSRSPWPMTPAGLEVDLRFTIFAGRPLIARSARDPQRGVRAGRPPLRDEPVAGPAGRRLADGRALRQLGARAPRDGARAGPRPAVRVERPRSLRPRAQPVPGAAPGDDRRGPWRGLRVQPRLLGQLPGRGRGRTVRNGSRPPRHRALDVRLATRAGGRVHARPRRSSPTRRAAWASCPMPSTASSASGLRAAVGATGRGRC